MKGTWKRGHKLRSEVNGRSKLTVLPGPDDDLDAGESDPDPLPGQADDFDVPDWLNQIPDEPEPEVRPDPPAGKIRSVGGTGRSKPKTTRVTVGMRKDVEAKIRFVLLPAGNVWATRDPYCGGTFVQQEPEISAALAELVCDSPDLLAWFTGPAGGFMKYFRLLMAVQPVALMVWGHHIAHANIVVDPMQPQQAEFVVPAA